MSNIKIINNGGVYTLYSEQIIHQSLEKVWEFFSRPENLQQMTPDDLNFEIIFLPERFYEGMFITYKIKIFPFIKTKWVTEITKIAVGHYFIDEQRVGPYSIWHHEHHFQKLSDNQVKMIDIVHFKIPLGILGKLAYITFVRKKLLHIFQFRYNFVEKYFNSELFLN